MVKKYAFRNLQLQSHLPGASQHHSCFAACSGVHAFCHSWLQTCIARASCQIDKRSHSADNWDLTAQTRGCSERDSFWALAAVWCTIFFPKVFRRFWSASRAIATVLCAFCQQLSQIEPRNRGNRDPTSATPGATLPEKTQGFAPETVFTREFTRFQIVALPVMVGWHDDAVDMMVEMLTVTVVCNSETPNWTKLLLINWFPLILVEYSLPSTAGCVFEMMATCADGRWVADRGIPAAARLGSVGRALQPRVLVHLAASWCAHTIHGSMGKDTIRHGWL